VRQAVATEGTASAVAELLPTVTNATELGDGWQAGDVHEDEPALQATGNRVCAASGVPSAAGIVDGAEEIVVHRWQPIPSMSRAKWGQASIHCRCESRDSGAQPSRKGSLMSVAPESSSHVRALRTDASSPFGRGPLRCGSCGYEVVSYRVLPVCPMCREVCWEPAPSRPFTRKVG
jgi:hypothetical protein